MKKIIFLLFACFACMQGVSAQDFYESSSDIYGLGKTNYQKKWVRTFNFSIARQVELGLNFRRNFGRYFAWDVYGFSYGYHFGKRIVKYESSYTKPKSSDNDEYTTTDKDEGKVSHEFKFARTGIRAFTPQMGNLKFFAALGVGGEYMFCDKINSHTVSEYNSYYTYTSGWTPGVGPITTTSTTKHPEVKEESSRGKDCTGLFIDLQLGVYVNSRFSIGYQAIFHKKTDDGYGDHTDHMFRIALDF